MVVVRAQLFRSQKANMLLGRDARCADEVDEMAVRRAVKAVQNLGFVILREEFVLSVRLFHAVFGGVPHAAQVANVRPGLERGRKEGWRVVR